ncbi:MAG: hypothetical protein IJT34_04940 [Butyrivibrio sp.]|nr:hypothetical protein [Butyrivibrio sp.]
MSYRRTRAGFCIWAIYTAFACICVGINFLLTGVLPPGQTPVIRLGCMGLSFAASGVISCILCLIANRLPARDPKNGTGFFGVILGILVVAGGILLRALRLMWGRGNPRGELALFEEAQLVENGAPISKSVLLSWLYKKILHFLMRFLGNDLRAAVIYQIVLQGIVLIGLFLTLWFAVSDAAAVCGTAVFAFLPPVVDSVFVLSQHQLFLALFAVALAGTVILIRGIATQPDSGLRFFFGLLVGAGWGWLTFMDAGVLFVWPILYLSILFLRGEEDVCREVHVFLLFMATIACFAGMLAQERGMLQFMVSAELYFRHYLRYFGGLQAVAADETNGLYGLAAAIGLFPAIFAFWRQREEDRIAPWMLITVCLGVGSACLNISVFHSWEACLLVYAMAFGCGLGTLVQPREEIVALAATPAQTEGASEELTLEEVIRRSEDSPEPSEDAQSAEVSETTEADGTTEAPTASETAETAEVPAAAETEESKESKEAKEAKEETEITETKESMDKTETGKENGYYVPEGMILPTGDEDEAEAAAAPRMRLPEPESFGVIALRRDPLPDAESDRKPYRDAFDVDIAPGDDFDI